MDEWPGEKKDRIAEVIRSLQLPPEGEALDFGCGNGVLTTIRRRALPEGWKVAETDLSSVAIANACSRFPDCEFFTAEDPIATGQTFDLLLTHHVLEHVSDLDVTIGIMDSLVRDRGAMLHRLPCGNPGSFKHRLATNRAGGIDPEMQGRFVLEDEGHVRRLTTDALAERLASRGFRPAGESYANQHDAAIDWITRSPREAAASRAEWQRDVPLLPPRRRPGLIRHPGPRDSWETVVGGGPRHGENCRPGRGNLTSRKVPDTRRKMRSIIANGHRDHPACLT